MQKETEKVYQWIESGKQVGKVFSYQKNGETCWSSIGVQKWKGVYKVYFDEILESKMDSEEYLTEEIVEFEDIASISSYVSEKTHIKLDMLTPCKGQKIFNPAFNTDSI